MLRLKEEQLSKLVDAFLKGQVEAFEEIVPLIYQDVLNIAYRYLGNLEDAKDVLQEVLMKIYHNLKFFRKTSKLSTWIYRVTVNAAVDFLRKRKRIFNLGNRYKENKTQRTPLRETIDLRDKEAKVRLAVAGLPLRQKNVFILRHYQSLTISEISEILTCSQSAVKTHLSRAVENLKKNIGGL